MKEVAGTKVYTERRSESVRLLQESSVSCICDIFSFFSFFLSLMLTFLISFFHLSSLLRLFAAAKMSQVDEIVSTIETRLNELEGERKEFTEYQELDKEKRAVEFAIYQHELADSRSKLENVCVWVS